MNFADVYTIWVSVYLLSITAFILQKYVAICKKFTSVPLTGAQLQDYVQKLCTSNINLVSTL